jgi:SSS family solute:Na+ symporter
MTHPLQLALLLIYAALLILIGQWIGRRVGRAADFFVAGRGLSAPVLFATVLAANIGAGSTVGATGLAYSEGVSAWWWNGSAGLGSLALAFWVGPRIWQEAHRHGFLTTGDFLEHHFGAGVRALLVALLWLGTTAILATQLIGLGTIVSVMTGLPMAAGTVAGAIVSVAYFRAGGLLSSAWVNLVQLVVLLVGFGVAVPIGIGLVGGWSGLQAASTPRGFFDFWHVAQPGSGWARAALFGPAFFLSPGLIQKAYGASSARAVRTGIGANAVVLMLFAFVPAFLGMVARVRHPGLPSPELALPTLLASDIPPAMGGLGLAAVVSAEVSTADTVLFMLATSLSQDLYRRFVHPRASDAQVLRVARAGAVAGGGIGLGIALLLPTIRQTLSLFYGLVSVSLIVPILAGLFSRRAGKAEAYAGITAGIATTAIAYVATGGTGVAGLTADNLGLLGALVAWGGVTLLRRPPIEGR